MTDSLLARLRQALWAEHLTGLPLLEAYRNAFIRELDAAMTIPAMPQFKDQPKRPPGRPEVPEKDRLVVGSIRLTQAQWDKLAKLGGAEWLRKKIDAGRLK